MVIVCLTSGHRLVVWEPKRLGNQLRHYFANKGPSSQGYGFSSSYVWMWELDYKESLAPNWCFCTVVLEKTLESPLGCKEILSILKEISLEYWLERPMLKLKLQYSSHLMWRIDSLGKDPDTGKDWTREEKGMTEDEMVGWHHWLDGQEFEQAPEVADGQRSLACCSPWGCKDLETTKWQSWTELKSTDLGRFCKFGSRRPK